MKFQLLNALVLVAGLLVVSTIGEPLLTDSVRLPLQMVAVVLAVVNLLLERMLRPKPGSRPAMLVNKVMMATLIKMGLVLAGILIYVVLDAPDPRHFGIATYLLYAAFTSVLVAESMRHNIPPTVDSE